MNNWISAGQARPNNGDKVVVNYLGCTDSGIAYTAIETMHYEAKYDGNVWQYGSNSMVTHWLPLPVAPIRNIDQ